MSGIGVTAGPGEEPAGAPIESEFDRVWRTPRWLGRLSAANHVVLGRRYIVTAFIFFLVGGIEAMFMRTQLIFPENHVLTPYQYNQIFTMHGTTMLFLFATPVMLATAIFLLPMIIGARDIAFPRLTAFGYWIYLAGGILLYVSFLVQGAPDAGWFMYQPLTAPQFSPRLNQDFWYFGVALVESSSVIAAIELTVTILKSRAPGFTINRMPTYAWYMLGTSFMIIFGFPVIIIAALMAEAERGLGLPFFIPSADGKPLLWEHLFWIFGHPEVYVIFLPGAGIVSTILPTFARARLIAYDWIVLAIVGTVFFSFGVWVHHMFTTGIPRTALSFFSGASLAVAVPSGIQIFAYLATIWHGRPVITTPFLFLLGFVFIFVLGGLSGVTLAIVPFNWQVNDSYYVVSHFHYVIIGGMVFPLFAALHYWMPLVSGRMLSERLGRVTFWVMFFGFNLAFLPMFISGLWGMPRRIYTYPAASGWEPTNFASTIGGYVFAIGVLLFLVNLAWHFWGGADAGINPWNAGTLEWAQPLPVTPYKFRSIPELRSQDPIWDDSDLAGLIARGEGFLPRVHEDAKEMLGTSMVGAEPDQVVRLPKPSYMPLFTAMMVTLIAAALLARMPWLAIGGVGGTILGVAVWLWDRHPIEDEIDVGHGLRLPVSFGDHKSNEHLGMIIFLMADFAAWGTLVYSYFFQWATTEFWPPPGYVIGHHGYAFAATGLLVVSLGTVYLSRLAGRHGRMLFMLPGLLVSTALLAVAAWCVWKIFSDLPFDYTSDAYAAEVVTLAGFGALHLAAAVPMMVYTMARGLAGFVKSHRYIAIWTTGVFSMYAAVQMLVMLGIIFL